MNTPNVHAGRLERRVRRVGRKTMPDVHGFCSFFHSAQYAESRYCARPFCTLQVGYGVSDLGILDLSSNSQPLGAQSSCESKP